MYLSLLQIYHRWGAKTYLGHPQEMYTIDLQLTFSRDGWNWERLANHPVFIQRGVIGSWDAGMISTGRFFEYGDEIRIYYYGYNGSHNVPNRTSGIGLARLPKERIVARAAGDELGTFITKPFRLEGGRLEINANAERGLIKAEVTDPIGNPLDGYNVRDCREIRRNDFRIPVEWNGSIRGTADRSATNRRSGGKLGDLKGKPVRLRFYLLRTRLYSFTIS